MVLDENNATLYFKDRIVKLSEKQNIFLSILIDSNDKCCLLEELSKVIYKEQEKKAKKYKYDYRISGLIDRINKKTEPDFTIMHKFNMYCYIETKEYDSQFKKLFFQNHKDTFRLLKKYKQLEKTKKAIQLLHNKIKKC